MSTWRWWALVFGVACACVGLITLGQVIVPRAAIPADLPSTPLIVGLTQWDASWYADIAEDGYWYVPGQQSPVAFFPL
ncbi:MAG: hypothetical protein JNG84_05045, partial [Archangium sp.]|nr:hypothetical protein [Archangium sp.]